MPWRPLRGEAPETDLRPVGASLGRLAASLGTPPPDVLGVVFARWSEVVGPSVAAHARPVTLRDGILVVAADQPAWATQLTFLQADIVARLNAAAGTVSVKGIDVRVGRPTRRRRRG